MLIFNSKANYDQQKAYLNFQIFRRKKMYMNNLITFLGLAVILVIMLIRENYTILIAAGILMIINILMFILMIRRLYRINLYQKDFSKIDELLVKIDSEKIFVENKRTNDNVEIPIDNLLSLCDLKNYLFLYLTDTQAICLDKKDITEGSLEEFLNNLPEGFKNKRYRRYYR